MKKLTALALLAAAAAGAAVAVSIWKRNQDEAALRYDSDEFDDDDDFCAEEDCNSCGVCDDEVVDEVKEEAEDAAEEAAEDAADEEEEK